MAFNYPYRLVDRAGAVDNPTREPTHPQLEPWQTWTPTSSADDAVWADVYVNPPANLEYESSSTVVEASTIDTSNMFPGPEVEVDRAVLPLGFTGMDLSRDGMTHSNNTQSSSSYSRSYNGPYSLLQRARNPWSEGSLEQNNITSYSGMSIHDTSQDDFQLQSPVSSSVPPVRTLVLEANPINTIGSMHSVDGSDDYIFKCCSLECAETTFGRWYELKRHHEGTHATSRIQFWCQVDRCERSEACGDRPFPRIDKLKDHMRQKHRL